MADDTTTTSTDTATADAAAAAAAATTDTTTTTKWDEASATKVISELRAEAAKGRVALKEFQSKTETERKAIARALGIGEDATPDPVKLQEALSSKDAT